MSDTPSVSTSGYRGTANVQAARDYNLSPVKPSYPAPQSMDQQDTLNPSSQLVRMPSLRRRSSLANTTGIRSSSQKPSVITSGSNVYHPSSIYPATSHTSQSSNDFQMNVPQPVYRSLLGPPHVAGTKRKEAPQIYAHEYAPYSVPKVHSESLPSVSGIDGGAVGAQTSYVEWQAHAASASASTGYETMHDQYENVSTVHVNPC